MEKKNSGGMNIGTSSILVTFVLLCLVTFATLTYLSAKSDYKLSEQTADRIASYYDANRVAEIYMANIEAQLSRLCNNCESKEEYFERIPDVFKDNDLIVVEYSKENTEISYSVPVTESQNLCVVLKAYYPDENDGMMFTVERWQTQVNNDYIEEIKSDSFDDNGTGLIF